MRARLNKFAKIILRGIGFNKFNDRANYIIAVFADAILCFGFYYFSYKSLSKDETIYVVMVLNGVCFVRRIVKNLVSFLEITNLPQDGGKQHGIGSIVNIYTFAVAFQTIFFFNVVYEVLKISDIMSIKDYVYAQAVWFLLLTGIDEFFDILVKAYNAEIV